MKIGLDVSGGDFAPKATIDGALLAKQVLDSDVTIVLYGDELIIQKELASRSQSAELFEIVHAPQVITYHDHPTRALPKKPEQFNCCWF